MPLPFLAFVDDEVSFGLAVGWDVNAGIFMRATRISHLLPTLCFDYYHSCAFRFEFLLEIANFPGRTLLVLPFLQLFNFFLHSFVLQVPWPKSRNGYLRLLFSSLSFEGSFYSVLYLGIRPFLCL